VYESGVNSGNGVVVIRPLTSPIQQQTLANASSTCKNASGQQVVENTTQGVHTFVYTRQASTTEFDVCWRAEDVSAGVGVGGMLAITPTSPNPGAVGIPSTDSNATACSTTTPNAVPGSHPTTSGGVGGQPYAFDAYSDAATTVWACLTVGTAVNSRVIVPISVSSPTTGPLVTWYPDSGTP
jgi:hypothetical protein